MFRVLAPGGVYICVSYAPPEKRLKFFEDTYTMEKTNTEVPKYAWSVTVQKLPKMTTPDSCQPIHESEKDLDKNCNFVYIMKKEGGPPETPSVAQTPGQESNA